MHVADSPVPCKRTPRETDTDEIADVATPVEAMVFTMPFTGLSPSITRYPLTLCAPE